MYKSAWTLPTDKDLDLPIERLWVAAAGTVICKDENGNTVNFGSLAVADEIPFNPKQLDGTSTATVIALG